ncbi:nuclear import and export protein [Colletotrichum truncatum]|uniref:Nuclear import and export protein n=1 Tax=Colletotrichum truncatum TaxID=5467 RepID=A0ACC3Z5U7_COLTU|nr:nuclear import and export protein [Colletotrichum truncatum]KAF6787256.1 nuclear import and export protein [Colletotrichum truncatum]
MDGQAANGAANMAQNATPINGGNSDVISQIHQALEAVHNPYSSNDARRDAQSFLENIKGVDEAPFHGFTLASDKSQSPVVRHYALSLLEYAIKQRWAEYNEEQSTTLRGWVLELCRNLSKDDPLYIRNKTAQLWVEIAKRCWGSEWMDMDELLLRLWQIPDSAVHKELVLFVLETLSDEVFNGDDAVVAMREGVLSRSCVEIFTPAAVLREAFPNRTAGPEVRYGDEGWLSRVAEFLNQCLQGDAQNDDQIRSCAVKSLSVFHSLMPWAIPKAVAIANCVPVMCRALATPEVSIQKASLEALHALYSRSNFTEQEFKDLVAPMYDSSSVDLLKRLFEWSAVDVEDIDEDKYQFGKKFSEMLSLLGNYLDRRFSAIPTSSDVHGFLNLLLLTVQSQSLIIAIPVLATWTRLLNNRLIGQSPANAHLVGPLLEVCGSRLIRYENLPEDTQDPTFLFLMEDTDTVPERHAFLGNYRRFSTQIIETIVQLKLSDAVYHILGQAEQVLQHLYDGHPPMDIMKYVKHSMPVLRVDAQFTVIEAALKGYLKWRASTTQQSLPDYEQQRAAIERDLESWCNKLLEMKFEDPLIRKRVLQLLVAFSTTALDKNPGFMLKVLEHILLTWPAPQPEHRAFNESIKDFQSESMVELQRLASKVPDHLLAVYDQIEAKVNDMISSGSLDEKRQIAYQSFLFIIIHRATNIDPAKQLKRLQDFIKPVTALWQNQEMKSALASYSGFCELMALDKAKRYLISHRVSEVKDWGSCELDAEGLALQNELEERQKLLPLRPTKSFLSFSVEKLEKSSTPFQISYRLWNDTFPIILPDLLQFLSHAHASHNPDNWTELSSEMRSVVGSVLSDRFWQAGISEGSKDEFYARVMDKKNTLEGLASTIRGTVRFVRETCYAIIYCMSRLEMQFYGFNELPGPLAQALFQNSFYLSAHQQINLLNLVRYLVDDCPLEQREHFLPPLLAACFQQMDAKINSEWEKLERQQAIQAAADALTEEMKSESILRQVTYTAVIMVADFLDPTKRNPPPLRPQNGHEQPRKFPSLRKFCLMQSIIVEPLLLFCTHAIRMRDTRCCSIILRVFRSIIPEFHLTEPLSPKSVPTQDGNDSVITGRDPYLDTAPISSDAASAIREYIASDVLRACITSFHEPYFVDLQKDLASLIASIVVYYSPLTNTPRDVLLSLPNVRAADLDKLNDFVSKPSSHTRQQRALVLDLLKDLKGVSVAEMGKLPKNSSFGRIKRSARSKMAQEFMTPANDATTRSGAVPGARRGTPDGLEGVANLFDT